MWLEALLVRLLNSGRVDRMPPPEDGLLLGHEPTTKRPVCISQERRREHLVVLGKTGSGKSYFLLHLALTHMRRGEGFVFFDFHGDAIAMLLGLAADVRGAAARVVLLDPTDPAHSPGLNPLERDPADSEGAFLRASELAAILRSRWSVESFGARTEEVLRNTLYLLSHHRLTLVEFPRVLTSTTLRQQLTRTLPNAEVRSYWQERFEPLSDAMKNAVREPLLNKVTAFLTDSAIRHLLGQPQSTIRFDQHMAEGDWVLVNLNKGRLREHAQTVGNLILAKLQFDVLARSRMPPNRRRLFSIICDEVQNMADNDLATLLTEGRKFGVSLITANQFWEQSPRPLRNALLAAGSQVFFRVSAADARALASELSVPGAQRYGAQLTELARGCAIARIGQTAPTSIHIPALPRISAEQRRRAADLRSLSIARVARDRGAIETEIAHRHQRAELPERTVTPPTHGRDDEGQTSW